MPRWEPGSRDRLERAALSLFSTQGYDETTVQDIARHAGLGKATFFRLFPDKREVLFWGQDLLATLLADGVAAAPPDASVAARLATALGAVGSAFPADRHDLAAVREAIVAGHPDLQERLAYKRTVLRDALQRALTAAGASPAEAVLGAEIGRAAFSSAYHRWAHAPDPEDFADLARQELDALLLGARRLSDEAPADAGP